MFLLFLFLWFLIALLNCLNSSKIIYSKVISTGAVTLNVMPGTYSFWYPIFKKTSYMHLVYTH